MLKTLSFNLLIMATYVALYIAIYILFDIFREYFRYKGVIMSKDLKYFMRKKADEIVKVPGPDTIKDEDGNVVELEIRIMPWEEINKIYENYTEHTMVLDKGGRPIVHNGEVVWKTVKNTNKAVRHVIVEALQYPDLKDPKLMEYYGCVDVTEMPSKVFSGGDEYNQLVRIVMKALGLTNEVDDKVDLDAAKN